VFTSRREHRGGAGTAMERALWRTAADRQAAPSVFGTAAHGPNAADVKRPEPL
jgi:hypothetical protein